MNIIGLDISTRNIGIAVINEKEKLLSYEVLKLDSKYSLEKRASVFKDKIKDIFFRYSPGKVYVEEPIIFMKSLSTALTLFKLHTFTGMCSYIVSELFQEPEFLNVNSNRKTLGIKIHRGIAKKDKKRIIVDWVTKKYEGTATPFGWEKTPKGNPKPGTDDIADAIVVALAGNKKKLKKRP